MTWLTDWVSYLPALLSGLKISVLIALIAVGIGYPLGLCLSIGVQSKNFAVHTLTLAVVEIGRGAPALVVLYLVYYGLPKVGLVFGSIAAACVALIWNAAAYSSEIIRAGLQSVPRGQLEAANALGLGRRDTFIRIILPQGIKSSIPGLMGVAIQVFQGTSLAYAIAVPELMQAAYNVGSENFNYLEVFILAGLMYAVISMPATWISVYFEKRIARR